MITEPRKKALESYVVTAIEGGAETINDVWSYIGKTPYWVEVDEVELSQSYTMNFLVNGVRLG